MPQAELPDNLVDSLLASLPGKERAVPTKLPSLTRRGLVPAKNKFKWEPDLCLLQGQFCHLVHAVAPPDMPDWVPEIPSWVEDPFQNIKHRYTKTNLLILVREGGGTPAWKIAGKLAEKCAALRSGLAFETSRGLCLALPPGFVLPPKPKSKTEAGHVPSWVLEQIGSCKGFSTHFAGCFESFDQRYRRATARSAPTYDRESELLFTFAKCIAWGDRRLFLPVDRVHELKEWERRRGPKRSRDHFFHTFNNLLLGFLLLGTTLRGRSPSAVPDRYIADSAHIAPWEALWLLTCLFHDRGYIAEKFWSTFSVNHAFTDQLPDEQTIPEPIATELNNAWETQFREARTDLRELYERLMRHWAPTRFREASNKFDDALRKAYFDGKRTSHSLLSGLDLMTSCCSDPTVKHKNYDKQKALSACEIATLSMMFHDQHCRRIFAESQISPIAFEDLPFAAALMFVDAIQDDRRDVTKNKFPKHGILEDLKVNNENGQTTVSATVCLPLVPLEYWPAKIQEYEGVMHWLNSASQARFVIDYKSRAWLR
ncbi:MAG: hypothetical protein A3G20_00680 [Acidobacteria bacterium RIFCSPLOWO2_12_FULL_59_11]|nr:MAG: hypothetical protein A3G20_00680 [Acidobacteria bacterium RIFCSPLOWO2_12_FULL_59_11]